MLLCFSYHVISLRDKCIITHVLLISTGHGAELAYVFHNLKPLTTPEEKQLADTVSQYWGQFVKTGDPNTPKEVRGPLQMWV